MLNDMKGKLTAAEKWWNEVAEYEATHEIAFASPRALIEARMIAAMDRPRSQRRRSQRPTVSRKSRESVAT
jgi:hypothetical protein